jgi:transposase-like protein
MTTPSGPPIDPLPCPRCDKTTAVVEVGQSHLSSRWFICHRCSKIWSSPPRRRGGKKR